MSLEEKYNKIITGFPTPNKPSTFGKPYTFPEDIAGVGSTDLGKWLFKLAGWKGYTVKLLAVADSVNYVMNEVLEAKITMKMATFVSDKKMVKDALRGKIIGEDAELKELKCRSIEKTGEVMMLKRLLEMYSSQLDIVSREISRRDQELKKFGGGIYNGPTKDL
jgi:hypothetical protein